MRGLFFYGHTCWAFEYPEDSPHGYESYSGLWDLPESTCNYKQATVWSSGEFLIPQAWAVCFGLFKLSTHSTTKDKVRPLHLFFGAQCQAMGMGPIGLL